MVTLDDVAKFLEKNGKVGFAVYVISVILFANSFSTLSPLEMGIARNNIASSVDKTK